MAIGQEDRASGAGAQAAEAGGSASSRKEKGLKQRARAPTLHSIVKLTIAWIGKTKNPAIQSLTNDYLKRLRQFTDSEGVSLKDEAALLKLCGRDGRGTRRILVLFDSQGKQLSSEDFAEFVRQRIEQNPSPLVFAMGAADGFSESARTEANHVLSLGKITIAHELARVVALEQIYRAFTILKGHPYHLGH